MNFLRNLFQPKNGWTCESAKSSFVYLVGVLGEPTVLDSREKGHAEWKLSEIVVNVGEDAFKHMLRDFNSIIVCDDDKPRGCRDTPEPVYLSMSLMLNYESMQVIDLFRNVAYDKLKGCVVARGSNIIECLAYLYTAVSLAIDHSVAIKTMTHPSLSAITKKVIDMPNIWNSTKVEGFTLGRSDKNLTKPQNNNPTANAQDDKLKQNMQTKIPEMFATLMTIFSKTKQADNMVTPMNGPNIANIILFHNSFMTKINSHQKSFTAEIMPSNPTDSKCILFEAPQMVVDTPAVIIPPPANIMATPSIMAKINAGMVNVNAQKTLNESTTANRASNTPSNSSGLPTLPLDSSAPPPAVEGFKTRQMPEVDMKTKMQAAAKLYREGKMTKSGFESYIANINGQDRTMSRLNEASSTETENVRTNCISNSAVHGNNTVEKKEKLCGRNQTKLDQSIADMWM
jgi:hypothetical protein